MQKLELPRNLCIAVANVCRSVAGSVRWCCRILELSQNLCIAGAKNVKLSQNQLVIVVCTFSRFFVFAFSRKQFVHPFSRGPFFPFCPNRCVSFFRFLQDIFGFSSISSSEKPDFRGSSSPRRSTREHFLAWFSQSSFRFSWDSCPFTKSFYNALSLSLF